ncbi:hypothetical protein SAMN04487948_104340 [Halogranum amylolyticum]|uniref:Uncharacterized protein n=1 Tax=Halogranum amylolyticum TaxID=660520 RepID=A0A1H8S0Q4_9EURY|nr:hypothetical protein [Halogranum amylolyticum]SEO71743.1 hypothetical protein SAMN04487948_104340 [Halogranum amylolyticum]
MDPHKPECLSPSQSLQQSVQRTQNRERAPEQTEPAVMAALDDTGTREQLVIADTTRDDAWVAVDADERLSLDDWR